MLSSLRQTVRPVGEFVAKPFVKAGISANTITLAAIPLSTLAAVLIAKGYFYLAFCLAVPTILLDFLDGAVARASKSESLYGNHLEAVVDRFVEGAILVGLSVHYPILSTTALTFSVLVSYIKARVGLVIISDNSDWPGIGDRTDRMILLLLALFLLSHGHSGYGQAALAALTLVALVGSVQRLKHSKNLIEEAQRTGQTLSDGG